LIEYYFPSARVGDLNRIRLLSVEQFNQSVRFEPIVPEPAPPGLAAHRRAPAAIKERGRLSDL